MRTPLENIRQVSAYRIPAKREGRAYRSGDGLLYWFCAHVDCVGVESWRPTANNPHPSSCDGKGGAGAWSTMLGRPHTTAPHPDRARDEISDAELMLLAATMATEAVSRFEALEAMRTALIDVERLAGGGELDYDHDTARERLRSIRARVAGVVK